MIAPVFVLCLGLVANDSDTPPSYVLETQDVQRVRGVLTFNFQFPNFQAREWILYAGRLPELPGQVQVNSKMEPRGETAQELSPLHRFVLRARVGGPEFVKGVPMKVTYEASLRARNLRALRPNEKPPAVPALSADEQRNALLERGGLDFGSPAFKKWIQDEELHQNGHESEVAFARRVFLHIRAKLTYEFKEGSNIHASAVCRAGKSDCGGLSNLFAAVMRANGIPARTLAGRWAKSAEPGERVGDSAYYQWHVKAEFFAAGVGWVPVDMASAIVWDKSKEGLRYFGRDPGDFLAFNVDDDLELDTIHFGTEKVENLQSPVYWVKGEGKLEPMKKNEGWHVEKLR